MNVSECPKCSGEMRYGEAFIRFTTSGGQSSSGFGRMGIPGMGVPSSYVTVEEKIKWREKTGQKKGWLIKSEERKTLNLYGKRCTVCGYIEFYALDRKNKQILKDLQEI